METRKLLDLALVALGVVIFCALMQFLFLEIVTAQELPPHLQPGPNLTLDINPDDIEHPEEPGPDEVIPAPPLACGVGDVPGEPGSFATCNPVNDWWCSLELACLEPITVSVAEVYAPSLLSPLGFPQAWYDHWRASRDTLAGCEANLAAHQHEISLWRAGVLVYEPPIDETCSTFADGPGGKLWKPISDNTRRPVFLLEASYQNERDLGAFDAAGNSVASVTFRTCCPNGGRSHFDVHKAAAALPKPTIIQVGSECFRVDDPTQRVD